ncbi:MAG: nucleotidyltransferase domain-containing protein [Anaerolineae bacterium]|nr:nucleotidyltransferase domain-containing protein [Anaerolineae bacterium]
MFRIPDNLQIEIPQAEIEAFCHRWQIVRLELFGSVLRDDFRPDSDVDVLVTFDEQFKPRLEDLLQMEDELRALLGRDVDLGTRKSVIQDANYLRRRAILDSTLVIYER